MLIPIVSASFFLAKRLSSSLELRLLKMLRRSAAVRLAADEEIEEALHTVW